MINAYYNGIFYEGCEVCIPLNDRSYYFGDGVYEVILGHNGRLFEMGLHLERLRRSCELTGIYYPLGIENVIFELLSKSSNEWFSLYIQLGRVSDERTHAPSDKNESSLFMKVEKIDIFDYKKDIKAITARDDRHRLCYIKSTNLLANVLASKTAHEKGCEEAIFIRDGIVTEGAKSSLLIICEDKIKTHPLTHDILPGITRNHILNIAAKMGLRVIEAPFPTNELFLADEVMITSTTKLARRVESIDGIGVGCRQSGLVRSIQSTMYDDILRST